MCVLTLAWQRHDRFPMILAGNRDEFHQRPTATAGWWEDDPDILAGRDLQAGGTWMGLSRRGRFAVVTNIREPDAPDLHNAPSRGQLVRDFLVSELTASAWETTVDVGAYAGFNLLFGTVEEARYLSNRCSSAGPLEPGIYGLSNHLLDTPWPKLVRAREGMDRCVRDGLPDIPELFKVLADRQPADDASLPRTGVPEEWERLLSPVFIVHPAYGTRASTVMMLVGDGAGFLEERAFDPSGDVTESRQFEFSVETACAREADALPATVTPLSGD
jgi:uncharacterized protein with NRDE domain